MKDTTILTIEKLKEQTAIAKSVDPALLEPFLEVAEEMHVEPILGTSLYSELIDDIENGTLSGNNETLVNNYVIPYSSWSCFYESSSFLAFKTHTKGIVRQASTNSDPVDIDELKLFKQSILDKKVFYDNRLRDYLNDNSSLYPNYRSDNDCSGTGRPNSTGFWLG